MVEIFFLFIFSVLLAAGVTHFAISAALTYGIADQPGGHKQHDTITPFVGGVGVLVALSVALIMLTHTHPEQSLKWLSLALGSLIIFVTGFADDLWQLNYKVRLIIQTAVALIMILAGDVVLSDLGGLLPGLTVELGLLAIPFTVFATIGVINALNMIDGVDGLAGTVSFISFLLISAIAFVTGDSSNLILAVALASGIAGFLYFNLRHTSQPRAKVFLGDNGSMLLGFLFAWLLIDLSQEPNLVMTPVTAIWLFAIPLMDIVSIVLRRIWLRRSPFTPDRYHLHHLLLRAAFIPEEVVFFIASLHLLLGMIGFAGWYLGISEFIMLIGFLLVYMGYFYLILRPWRFILMLNRLHTQFHARLKIAPPANSGTFFGNNSVNEILTLSQIISSKIDPTMKFVTRVFKQPSTDRNSANQYAMTLNILPPKNGDLNELEQQIASFQQQLIDHDNNIQLRQLTVRNNKNDRRQHNQVNATRDLRISERRQFDYQMLVFEALYSSQIKV